MIPTRSQTPSCFGLSGRLAGCFPGPLEAGRRRSGPSGGLSPWPGRSPIDERCEGTCLTVIQAGGTVTLSTDAADYRYRGVTVPKHSCGVRRRAHSKLPILS